MIPSATLHIHIMVPVSHSTVLQCAALCVLFLVGWTITRGANNQKVRLQICADNSVLGLGNNFNMGTGREVHHLRIVLAANRSSRAHHEIDNVIDEQYYFKIKPSAPYFGFQQKEGRILTCGWSVSYPS